MCHPLQRPVRSTVLVVEGAVLSHCSSKRDPLIEALAGSCSCLNSFVVSCEEVPSKPGLLRLAGPSRECYWASATLNEEMLTGRVGLLTGGDDAEVAAWGSEMTTSTDLAWHIPCHSSNRWLQETSGLPEET